MNPEILRKYDFSEMVSILGLLQLYTDNMIYSKNSPAEDHLSLRVSSKKSFEVRLKEIFDPEPVNNKTVRRLLEDMHKNFISIARESLPVITFPRRKRA